MSESTKSVAASFPALKKLGFASKRRAVPFVQQLEWTDCGAASLCMVMAYHGKEVKLAEVREAMGIGRDGVSAKSILELEILLIVVSELWRNITTMKVTALPPEAQVRLDIDVIPNQPDIAKFTLHLRGKHTELFMLEDPRCAGTTHHIAKCHCWVWEPEPRRWRR